MTTLQAPVVLCGVLDWFDGQRFLNDEPGEPHETSCWDSFAEHAACLNPWYAPIEDEDN
jgi:hypothetical protein